MEKKKTTKRSTHALFWTLLKEIPDYDERYKETIKEGLVGQYTGGRTCSLSEMYATYPALYRRMIEDLKGDANQRRARYDVKQDQARKRVIAAICTCLDRMGYRFEDSYAKIRYVKAIACRASQCHNFNDIEESRLIAIYNLYCKKNKVDIKDPVTDYQFSRS